MKLTFVYVSVLTLISFSGFTQDDRQKIIKEIAASDTCIGKEKCLVVYVAPWCPRCTSMTPKIKEWQKTSASKPDLGVRVIVGRGNQEQNEKYASEYEPKATIDSDSKFHDALSVKGFPMIILVNQDGTIRKRDFKVDPASPKGLVP